jgi:phage shock protein A
MNIFKRIFKIGESEAHNALDKLENPIKMTEQGIRDMKKDLDQSLHALAEVKALAIRTKNDLNDNKSKSADYEQKAMLLLQKAEKGELAADEADRIATEALTRKADCDANVTRLSGESTMLDGKVSTLETNIRTLRSNISKWENELKTLKARVKVSDATKKLNKQLANIDSTNTVSMLERMKEKVDQNEALSDAYGEIANESKSVDEEIDKALGGSSSSAQASDSLAALKAKMNQNKG